MKLHLNDIPGDFIIGGCGAGFVQINGARRETSVLLTTFSGIIPVELPSSAELLSGDHMHPVAAAARGAEVFLLGAGEHSPALKMEWLAPFAQIGASLEVMSLPAACRTYNVLQGDGRATAAVLLI